MSNKKQQKRQCNNPNSDPWDKSAVTIHKSESRQDGRDKAVLMEQGEVSPCASKLISLNNQWLNTHHRSGWPYAVESLLPLHSEGGVLFDGFLEKKFAWGHDPGDRYNHFSPYRVPWVGVLHNPPSIPQWFNL